MQVREIRIKTVPTGLIWALGVVAGALVVIGLTLRQWWGPLGGMVLSGLTLLGAWLVERHLVFTALEVVDTDDGQLYEEEDDDDDENSQVCIVCRKRQADEEFDARDEESVCRSCKEADAKPT
jgi:hypothetical protein